MKKFKTAMREYRKCFRENRKPMLMYDNLRHQWFVTIYFNPSWVEKYLFLEIILAEKKL